MNNSTDQNVTPSCVNSDCHTAKLSHSEIAQEVLTGNPILYDKIGSGYNLSMDEIPFFLTEVVRFLNLIAFSNQRLTPAKLNKTPCDRPMASNLSKDAGIHQINWHSGHHGITG